jgi:hypothetical protein
MTDNVKTALLVGMAMGVFLLLLIAICGFYIALSNRSLEPKYEYETFDGEKGMALYCYPINRNRQNPYCVLEDRTQVFDIKEFKKIGE